MKQTKDWGRWKNWRDSFFSSVSDDDLGQCKVCGRPAGAHCKQLHDRPTLRCDPCWEVESRLADYLKDGGEKARIFVGLALNEAHTNFVNGRAP
jgi:hypothetical protein